MSTNNRIAEYLKFANFQMAAEAFLNSAVGSNRNSAVTSALVQGNKHASRFPTVLATQFAADYEVVDHGLKGGGGSD